jgi:hypothetical protein
MEATIFKAMHVLALEDTQMLCNILQTGILKGASTILLLTWQWVLRILSLIYNSSLPPNKKGG